MEKILELSKFIFLEKEETLKKKEFWNHEKVKKKMWKPSTCNSKNIRTSLLHLLSVLFLAPQLGKAFRVENLGLQVIILVLSLIFPTIIARKRNASKDLFLLSLQTLSFWGNIRILMTHIFCEWA